MTRGHIVVQTGNFSLEVSWEVYPGQTLVIYGPSGAGKSTMLKAIAGLVKPISGHVEIHAKPVYDSFRGIWVPIHKRRIGYVPQNYWLFPHLSVMENISYGMRNVHVSGQQYDADYLLRMFDLQGVEKRKPHEISGGQQQRVALARAVGSKPNLLLLDEPFAALDISLRRGLRRQLIDTLSHWPIPVILVTHDREDVMSLGDTVIALNEGRVVLTGTTSQVLGELDNQNFSGLLGYENLYRGKVIDVQESDGTMECEVDGVRLWVPMAKLANMSSISLGLREQDVLIAMDEPTGLSARNILPARVEEVEVRETQLSVTLDCGILIRALVTPQAAHRLGIVPGARAWAVVKTNSWVLLDV